MSYCLSVVMQIYDKGLLWLLIGRQRRLVFSKLKAEFMPNSLRKEINQEMEKPISLREMSRHMRNFEKRGLIRCLNKKDPYNKIYVLTERGVDLQENLSKTKVV